MQASRVRWSFSDRYDNSALNARPYSLTQSNPAKISTYHNRPGISMGGPLVIPKIYNGREKTLLFINYQGQRSRSGVSTSSLVPTALERTGNFSEIGANLFLPGATFYSPRTSVGSVIPSALLSPSAVGLLQFVPLPNVTFVPGQKYNYYFQARVPNSTDSLNVRLNQTINQKLNLATTYSYNSSRNLNYNSFPTLTS